MGAATEAAPMSAMDGSLSAEPHPSNADPQTYGALMQPNAWLRLRDTTQTTHHNYSFLLIHITGCINSMFLYLQCKISQP